MHPDRDAQFCRIGDLIGEYEFNGNPWFSMDTKAKEHLGQMYRKGRIRCSAPLEAFDHDFPSWADGVVIPHGIYDWIANLGHINIGLSHDTSKFACDSFKWFWNRIGKQRYPDASSILLACDGGGSNSSKKYIFKYDLQQLSEDIGIEIDRLLITGIPIAELPLKQCQVRAGESLDRNLSHFIDSREGRSSFLRRSTSP